MNWVDFGILLNNNLGLYLLSLLIAFIVYFIVFRETYISFLDPLVFSLFTSMFGFALVVFLSLTNSIDNKYLINYLLTQFAYWIGFFLFKPLRIKSISSKYYAVAFKDEAVLIKFFFLIVTVFYVTLQTASFVLVGIPLFMDSHVDTYANSGGLGFLGRLLDVLKPMEIFLLCYIFLHKENKIFRGFTWLVLGFVMVSLIFSGSKSQFLLIGQILFIFFILNFAKTSINFKFIKKIEKIILFLGVFIVFGMFAIQLSQNENTSITKGFLFRLVESGDVYHFAYVKHTIEYLKGDNAFLALFGNIFAAFRLVPREQIPESLGITLFNYYYVSDSTAGPNPRLNVFAYVYYGFIGSIIFSFIVGLFVGYIRNKLFFKLRKNVFAQLFYTVLYLQIMNFETDPASAVSGIQNILIIFPAITLIMFVVYAIFSPKVKYSV